MRRVDAYSVGPNLDTTAAGYAKEFALVLVGNTLIAAILVASRVSTDFVHAFGFSQAVGLSIAILIQGGRHLLAALGIHRYDALAALIVFGLVIGTGMGLVIAAWMFGVPIAEQFAARALQVSLGIALVATLFATWFGWSRAKFAELRERIMHEALLKESAEKAAVRAQLQALQAQVEPHFLFNTLAALDSLIETDPARARELLAHLNRFLRAALVAARADDARLAQEFDVLDAMLAVQKLRFGERLSYRLDLPPDCVALPVPPMLLQPLVENALKHGIEPSIRGGTIAVSAARDGARLVLTISDTGVGFGSVSSTQGAGVGLSNVRARLAALYTERATLTIGEQVPHGVFVRLELPIDAANARIA